jgi:peptidoglycan/xylan/chitin deacetylase (PgdA/CDA1 family)
MVYTALNRVDFRGIGSRLLDQAAYWLDCGMSALKSVQALRQPPHAITVYFHGVLHEPEDGFVDPQERVTTGFLREFIQSMRATGYTFVTPDIVLGPDRPAGNLALLTSDDGYRSVEGLLPMLEEEAVPLTVFLTTEYSLRDAMYWWDQIYVAGRSQSRTKSALKHEVRTRAERDQALRALGIDPHATAFCDSHRLLSPSEVGRLGRSPHFCFGNHTRNHLSLPLLEDSLLEDEVEGARRDIEAWTGRAVHHFAFPYGDYDGRTLDLLRRYGYRTAFTTEPGHFVLPSGADLPGTHVLPRYRLRADRSAKWQGRIMGTGITTGPTLQAQLVRWAKYRLARRSGSMPDAKVDSND